MKVTQEMLSVLQKVLGCKKAIPYESEDEFLVAMKEHGPMIKGLSGTYYSILRVDSGGITTDLDRISYIGLVARRYVWQDGTPVAKELII